MAVVQVIEGDLVITGTLSATQMALPDSCVGNLQIQPNAAIEAVKLERRIAETYAQESATTAFDETKPIYTAFRAGTLSAFRASCVDKNLTGATVTFDLQKNGVSVLSAVVTLADTEDDRELVSGTINTAAYVAGDVFEVVINATVGAGTLGKGAFCQMIADEEAA